MTHLVGSDRGTHGERREDEGAEVVDKIKWQRRLFQRDLVAALHAAQQVHLHFLEDTDRPMEVWKQDAKKHNDDGDGGSDYDSWDVDWASEDNNEAKYKEGSDGYDDDDNKAKY